MVECAGTSRLVLTEVVCFAQLFRNLLMLLTEEERERVKGLIINKFHKNTVTILDPAFGCLTERGRRCGGNPVPYMELTFGR